MICHCGRYGAPAPMRKRFTTDVNGLTVSTADVGNGWETAIFDDRNGRHSGNRGIDVDDAGNEYDARVRHAGWARTDYVTLLAQLYPNVFARHYTSKDGS